MNVSPKILIVDDLQANLVVLQQTLSEVNAELIQARSGDEALRATLNHDFALAILDVQMPLMDGYELAEILRGDERSRYIPIIFLTAVRMEDSDVFKGYQAGAVDYIVKPYNAHILRNKVEVFLQLDRQRRLLHLQTKQLEVANRELEAFSYSASHDLRAPLRAIEGFCEALQEDYGEVLQGDGRTYLHYLQESTQEMSMLIDDLLRLSRSTHGEMVLQDLNLSLLVDKVVNDLQKQEQGRRACFSVMPDVIAHADSGLMLSVMENLVGNAWKYTKKCNEAHIEFGCEERKGKPTYYIRDNGAGFNMDFADKLFTPFERLHSRSEYPGTGIGLATVQRIIHRHGGDIWGEGEPDNGATFFFQLGNDAYLNEHADTHIT